MPPRSILPRSRYAKAPYRPKARLFVERLENRNLLSTSRWTAFFGGMTPGATFSEQTQLGRALLSSSGISSADVQVVEALDLSGAYLIQTPASVDSSTLASQLSVVPGFTHVVSFNEVDAATLRKVQPARARSEAIFGPFDYDTYLSRIKNGEFPPQGGPTDNPPDPLNSRTNNNAGSTGTAFFTQSETTLVAFGNTVVVGFNDSGSNAGGTNQFTGWAYSTDGGVTFTDGGRLPTSVIGDGGDPVMARDEVTGRIYYSTLGFSAPGTIQMFRSDDNGVSWMAPVNATPGGSNEDKQWHTVDNFPGPGQGNVYLLTRRFGTGPGIYFYRSTDGGNTFGPLGGTLIVSGSQGAFITVGPDHSIYAFWWAGTTLQMRKSTDLGLTFGPPVVVATGLTGGTNGDLGLTGRRQGTTTFSSFRSNSFPHVAVNPISGHLYVVFNDNPPGVDKADIYLVTSTDGGATWSARTRVNDDATTTDQWQPTVAVTPDGSRLGIFYCSREEDPIDNNLFKFYGRIGVISGATISFLPSFPVSDTPSLPEFGRDSVVNAVYMSDYDFAVSTPGFFHVTWADNREDLGPPPAGNPRKDPNVYYKKIALGLAVASTVPAVSSVVNTVPLNYIVNFTDPIDPSTVDASDFTVTDDFGVPVPANSFTINSPTQVTFHYTVAPFSGEGLHFMELAAGSILRAGDGNPLLAFLGPFRYDVTLLEVIATTPPFPGGVFTLPGPFTFDVTFNEPINPASVQTTDLVLTGIPGAIVTGATVLPGNQTVRFTISGITVEGTLTASISGSAITDAFGNAGSNFSATYAVDIGIVPYPTPLAPKLPSGSLIYDPSFAGVVSFVGDTDGFTLPIDPGQRITIILTPTAPGLRPTVTLTDPASVVLSSAAGAAAGQRALIQTVATTTGGTYTITVGGADGTVGTYSLQVILNAAQEEENTLAGVNNNSVATAQNIDASFLGLQTTLVNVQRGGVLGRSDEAGYTAAAISFGFEDIFGTGALITGLVNVDDASVSIPIGFTFPFYGTGYTSIFVSSNGLLTFGSGSTTFTNTDLTTTPTQAAIAPFWDDLHTGGGQPGSGVFFQVLGSGPTLRLVIQWNQVRFFSGGTTGDTLTFQAVLFADGTIRFNYLDLVSGSAAGNNGASATVGIKNAGTQGPDRVLLAFNNGPNAFVGTGQSTVLSLQPGDDWYTILVSPDRPVLYLETRTPSDGPGEFVNLLNPRLELYNPSGVLIATGTVLGDGRNELLIATGLAPGSYRVRISSEGNSVGEYFVAITPLRAPTPSALVDNRSFGFRAIGPGWGLASGGYNGDHRFHAGGGTGSSYAEFVYAHVFTAGVQYEFFATWVPHAANATNAQYQIYNGATLLGTVIVNQQVSPSTAFVGGSLWQSIFVFTPTTSGYQVIRVRITDNANGRVVADAIFDPPLGPVPDAAVSTRAVATPATVNAFLWTETNETAEPLVMPPVAEVEQPVLTRERVDQVFVAKARIDPVYFATRRSKRVLDWLDEVAEDLFD